MHLNSGIRRHVKLPACSTQHLHMHIDRPNEQMAHCARHTANRGERHNTSTDPCRGYYATRTRRPSIRGTRPRVSTVPCGGDKREVNEPAARVAQSPKLAWSGWSACLGEATACNYDARAAGGWPSYSGQVNVSTTNQTTSKGTGPAATCASATPLRLARSTSTDASSFPYGDLSSVCVSVNICCRFNFFGHGVNLHTVSRWPRRRNGTYICSNLLSPAHGAGRPTYSGRPAGLGFDCSS